MKDKIIINAISKIHLILLSAISFIFLILFTSFIILQNGIYIDNISFSNFKAKKLYIKWDEKLSFIVKELDIQKDTNNNTSKINLKNIGTDIKRIILLDSFVEKVFIEKISFNDVSGSFKYSSTEEGFLDLHSESFSLDSDLFYEDYLFNIKINSFVKSIFNQLLSSCAP